MGSRIMHVIIANGIAEKLCIQDKTSFLLGAVAPMLFIQKKKKAPHIFMPVQRRTIREE